MLREMVTIKDNLMNDNDDNNNDDDSFWLYYWCINQMSIIVKIVIVKNIMREDIGAVECIHEWQIMTIDKL